MRLQSTAPVYQSPEQIQVLANGDIVECGRLPTTARNSLYKTELCKHFNETGACRYGSKCQFAHGEDELRGVLRHPKYKTTRCKAFLTTGRCLYGSRCRFIHTDRPERDYSSMSSSSSESDESEHANTTRDLLVNPYADGALPIDLSIPFGGLKQVTLTPLTSIGSSVGSPLKLDGSFFRDSFSDLKFGADSETSSSTSSLMDSLEAMSPRSDPDSLNGKFSRLSIFQRICREGTAGP
ncbi:hypothetical protein Poli38472_000494 [Pythium oligandrum]|uniref:C3H1-type domain-containing protein n=1 Tax=Pythium oligandrum TaxID=41045 RepID=A0A8K1FI58_PYTOL|nr:hypothetical protein Poli38472_000494 [Pythium oligandrum]|eukprot:TMW60452.1 hypothetical protein Poli38472_000494 [Pythium oligandrum]